MARSAIFSKVVRGVKPRNLIKKIFIVFRISGYQKIIHGAWPRRDFLGGKTEQ